MGSNKRSGDYDCNVCGKREWDVFLWGYVPDKCRECSHKALMQGAYDFGRKLAEKQEQRIINAILGFNMPQFKVGDEVRVKAGSGEHLDSNGYVGIRPNYYAIGVKMRLDKIDAHNVDGRVYWCCQLENDRYDHITEHYLEPWNHAEEWNGSAWVAKEVAKPAIVVQRDKFFTGVPAESTNEAFRLADYMAEKSPGAEFVVYQEKGSRRVEKSPVLPLEPGGTVTVTRNGISQAFMISEFELSLRVGKQGTLNLISIADAYKS